MSVQVSRGGHSGGCYGVKVRHDNVARKQDGTEPVFSWQSPCQEQSTRTSHHMPVSQLHPLCITSPRGLDGTTKCRPTAMVTQPPLVLPLLLQLVCRRRLWRTMPLRAASAVRLPSATSTTPKLQSWCSCMGLQCCRRSRVRGGSRQRCGCPAGEGRERGGEGRQVAAWQGGWVRDRAPLHPLLVAPVFSKSVLTRCHHSTCWQWAKLCSPACAVAEQ